MTNSEFRSLIHSLANIEESPHFERIAFKVVKKRIFVRLHEESSTVNMKLSEGDQSVFATLGKGAVYPVPNKWGLQGWTTFELKQLPKALIKDALEVAYRDVFEKRQKGP